MIAFLKCFVSESNAKAVHYDLRVCIFIFANVTHDRVFEYSHFGVLGISRPSAFSISKYLDRSVIRDILRYGLCSERERVRFVVIVVKKETIDTQRSPRINGTLI